MPAKNLTKVKLAKMNDSHRTKLINTKEELLVHVKTHDAACRYGSNTDWCTSTPSDSHHYDLQKKSSHIFIYINKSFEIESKLCILVKKRTGSVEVYSSGGDNYPLEDNTVRLLNIESILSSCQSYYSENLKRKTKPRPKKVNSFKVGDLITAKWPKSKINEHYQRYRRFPIRLVNDWSGTLKTGNPTIWLPLETVAKAKVLARTEKHINIQILELRECPRAKQKQIENFEKVLAIKDKVQVHFSHFELLEAQ